MKLILPPFVKSVDIFGDGSLWAISSSGYSKGHGLYFINGMEDKILVTGDACNTEYQFDNGIGPGYLSIQTRSALVIGLGAYWRDFVSPLAGMFGFEWSFLMLPLALQ
jgi:hypothetical protein